MNSRKGFTLIELLAVIIVLSVIGLIAVVTVNNIINHSKQGAALRSSEMYLKGVKEHLMIQSLNGNIISGSYTVEQLTELGVEIDGTLPDSNSSITIDKNKVVKYQLFYDKYVVYPVNDEAKIILVSKMFNPTSIIENYTYNSGNGIHKSTYKSKVKTITFEVSKEVPNNAVDSIDVSKKKDGSVMAWWILRDDENYDLHIGANNGVKVEDMSYMFSVFSNLEKIDLTYLDTSSVKNMGNTFSHDSSLTTIVYGKKFNTGSVTNMYRTFYGCKSLKTIDFTKWDTTNVKDMKETFYSCTFNEIDLSPLDLSNVKNFQGMFKSCRNLKKVITKGLHNNVVTTITGMFMYGMELTEIDLSWMDTKNVTDMTDVFAECKKIKKINLTGWDTSNVTAFKNMFYNTKVLESIQTSSTFVINPDADTSGMFASSGLSSIN